GGTPVVLDADVDISDAELDALDNYNGASVTLVRNTGADAEDVFSNDGLLGILTEGQTFAYDGTTIGTVTTNNGTLVLTFNSDATSALVDATLQSIAYSNSSDDPPASAQINWTFDDGDASVPLQATGSTTVSITAVNDTPTLAATPADDTLTENTDVTSDAVFPTVTIDPIETGDSISEAQVTLAGGLEDSDIINVNGTAITGLTTTSATTAALAGGGTYDYDHTTGVLTINFAGSTNAAAAETILEAITFGIDASDNDPSTIARTVTLNTVTDNGGGGSSDTNADINEMATISVGAVNDEPTFTNLNGSTIFTEDDTAVVLDADVDISDAELDALSGGSGNYDGSTLTLVRNGSANADDRFSNSGLLATLTESGALTYNDTDIGTVSTNNGGTLVLIFDANATSTLVDSTLQSIAYSNANGTPPASVQIDWTFDDGDPGGALQATGNSTVYIDLTDAANTVVVDTTSDIADGDTSNVLALMNDKGADGMISLREAILATNNTVNDGSYLDRIEFDFIDNQAGHYYYQDD
ncbi:MAG: hypothetical protein GY698_21840, partial [Actinomycetia bacterium]|nr:hypothetical protein [Actinomycetes bacterium]